LGIVQIPSVIHDHAANLMHSYHAKPKINVGRLVIEAWWYWSTLAICNIPVQSNRRLLLHSRQTRDFAAYRKSSARPVHEPSSSVQQSGEAGSPPRAPPLARPESELDPDAPKHPGLTFWDFVDAWGLDPNDPIVPQAHQQALAEYRKAMAEYRQRKKAKAAAIPRAIALHIRPAVVLPGRLG
jgi:hypothetical protein